MAIFSLQCVDCKDCTKRCSGRYYGRDKAGKYYGEMYDCSSTSCRILFERKRRLKQAHAFENNR